MIIFLGGNVVNASLPTILRVWILKPITAYKIFTKIK